MRKLEGEKSKAHAKYILESKKRKHAEAELAHVETNLEVVLETQDRVTRGRLRKASGRHSRGSATAIICATDWHAESTILPETIDGANEFNLKIAAERIERTWQKAVYLFDFASNVSNLNEVVLWLGGDLINGIIHDELRDTNGLGQVEAIVWVQDQVATGIEFLKKNIKRPITVVTSYGNHGRSGKQKPIENAWNSSWEWFAYTNLARAYRNDSRVKFKVAKGYHNWLEIQGRAVRFHHGDAIRFSGGVGGVHIPLKKKIHSWNTRRRAELDVIGHFHQRISDWRYDVIGCLIGYNEFAQHIAANYEAPTQGFIVMDRDFGKVMSLPIFCEPNPQYFQPA